MVSISDLLDQQDKEKQEPPKLTKKEKKQLQKLKKKLEAEAKIRKAQEDEMDIDAKVTQKNIETFRAKWKEIRMEKARPEFKEYMAEHWSLFDHLIDRKDKLIDTLTEELEHAERTRERSVTDNVRELDKLLHDFYHNMDNVKTGMYETKQALLNNRNHHAMLLSETTARTDENMRLISYLVDQTKKKNYLVWGGEMINKIDEEISKNRSEMDLMILHMEEKMINFWKPTKIMLEEYFNDKKKILKVTEPLMEKVKADEQIIRDDKEKINAMQTQLDNLKWKQPTSTQLRDLIEEREKLHEIYTQVLKFRSQSQQEHETRMQWVITENKATNDYLNSILMKGKKIIKLYELCRNFETKRELYEPMRPNGHTRCMYDRSSDIGRSNQMFKFWKHVGRSENMAYFMKMYHNKLKRRNNKLRKQLEFILRTPKMQTILKNISQCLLRN